MTSRRVKLSAITAGAAGAALSAAYATGYIPPGAAAPALAAGLALPLGSLVCWMAADIAERCGL
jgi:hypothetical protein